MDDIIAEFVAETSENLEDLGSVLIAWEKTPDDIQLLNHIFRFFHTIKGSAGFLQLDEIGRIAHAAEDILDNVRQGDVRVDHQLIGQIHVHIDTIMVQVQALLASPGLKGDTVKLEKTAYPAADDRISVALAEPEQHGRSIRIAVSLIDTLLENVADFTIITNEFNVLLNATAVSPKLRQSFERVLRMASDVRSAASHMRLQRMDRLFAPLPKAVRDLAHATGKLADISTTGGAVELDRDMLDKLRDPITHIVRNAIDHGIETPELREAAGKPRVGNVHVEAHRRGNDIEISISDDGAGIDIKAVMEQGKNRGLIAPHEAKTIDDSDIVNLLTSPGFSTRNDINTLSGRGVGLDVVRSNIEQIGGHFEIISKAGQGMTVQLRVPLSMSVVSCLILQSGKIQYHAPTEAIRQIWLVDNPKVRIEAVAGTHVLRTPSGNYPLLTLENILTHDRNLSQKPTDIVGLSDKVVIIMQALNGFEFAILVDDALEYADAVIRPISPLISRSGPYCGVSLRDNGDAILLLDVLKLLQNVHLPSEYDVKPVPMPDPIVEQHNAVDAVTLARDLSGAMIALPFAMVRRVEQFSAAKHVALDGAHWYKSLSQILPMGHVRQNLSSASNHVLILGDNQDECAFPVSCLIDAIAHGHVQQHNNSKKYHGIVEIDGEAVPLLRVDAIVNTCAQKTRGDASLSVSAQDSLPKTRASAKTRRIANLQEQQS